MRLITAFFLLCSIFLCGQVCVPYHTADGRFGVFQEGRFTELEPASPAAVHPAEDRLVYMTPAGELRGYVNGHAVTLEKPGDIVLRVEGPNIAWKQGAALRVLREEGPLTICAQVGEFTVSDSLVVYHNLLDKTLCMYWRGRSVVLADVVQAMEAPQWKTGSNMVVFYIREQRKVMLAYRGDVVPLCTGADYALAVPGGDLVAYMDDNDDIFRFFERGKRKDMEDLRPVSFVTGLGCAAWVSGTGRFRAYADGTKVELAKTAPSSYEVRDSVITWLEGGLWKTLADGRVETIERYVPEKWQVDGARIAYQDLNRELRMYHKGERIVLTTEPGIRAFTLVGDAVAWNTTDGAVKVWWRGKVWTWAR